MCKFFAFKTAEIPLSCIPVLDLQGNRPRPQTLILMKRTYTYKAHFIEHSGAFKVGSKWGEVGENRPQSGRFGLSFTRNFDPKR